MVQSSQPKALMILRESSLREVTPNATRQKVQNITINAGPWSAEPESPMLDNSIYRRNGEERRFNNQFHDSDAHGPRELLSETQGIRYARKGFLLPFVRSYLRDF